MYQSKEHEKASEAKIKTVAEWQKSPKNWEEIDKMIQEHFEEHGQVNPNKKQGELKRF